MKTPLPIPGFSAWLAGLLLYTCLLLLLVCISTAWAQTPTIRFVKAGATGNGSSWANASGELQTIINASQEGDQVWLAAGVYKPTAGSDRSISFAMKNGVALYGGFGGTESQLNQRPPINPLIGQPSSTTLSGDIGAEGDNSDNSYQVMVNSYLSNSTLLDGVVITGGNANADYFEFNSGGGGIYNTDCSLRISNCSFVGNSVRLGFRNLATDGSGGGAIYNSLGSPTITNCSFVGNTATGTQAYCGGGAIYNNYSSPTIANCSFVDNSTTALHKACGGGAIYNSGSGARFINCSFVGNTATGAQAYCGGGAMFNNGSPSIINCSFVGNSAPVVPQGGGGVFYNSYASRPTLTNSVVWNNGGTNTFANYDTSNDPNLAISTTIVRYSLLDNTAQADITGPGNLTTSVSPFASPTSVALAAGSPAIDAGSTEAYTAAGGPPTDLVGNPRLVGTACQIDMGSQEYAQSGVNVSVRISPLPSSGTALCAGGTVTTSVSTSGSVASYQWYQDGSALSGQRSATLTLVNTTTANSGRYVVVVTGVCNSLTSTAFSLTVSPAPSASLVNDGPLTCTNHRVSLRAGGGTSYSFSGGALANGNQAQVTAEGLYSVTVTGANGCTATQTTQVSSNTIAPNATLSNNGLLTCTNRTVTLNASGGGTYAFSPGTTPNGNTATVTNEGPYSVTVTSANGCTATATTQVTSNTTAPNATLTNTGPLTANQPTVTLIAGGGTSYAFSSSASQQGGGNTATVTTPGNYQVTVTTGTNGCSATASTVVTGAVSGSSCRNGSGVITVIASGTPVKYEWYRNSINSARLTENPAQVRGTSTASLTLVNQQVTADYYVRVTDSNGSAIVYGPFRFTVNLGCNIYARTGAEEVELKVILLGNPVQGDQLRAIINGAEGKALSVQLLDLQGRSIHSQQWQQAPGAQSIEWTMSGQSNGVYLLQATTPDQRQSVKVIK